MRNWKPFIKDALAELAGRGIERVVGIPMAPQFSTLSVQKYVDAATAALPAGLRFDAVTSYHSHPLLLQAFAERVREAAPTGDEHVIFTAHSLPVRVIDAGDVYADRGRGHRARRRRRWPASAQYDIAYQSAGPDARAVDRSRPERADHGARRRRRAQLPRRARRVRLRPHRDSVRHRRPGRARRARCRRRRFAAPSRSTPRPTFIARRSKANDRRGGQSL